MALSTFGGDEQNVAQDDIELMSGTGNPAYADLAAKSTREYLGARQEEQKSTAAILKQAQEVLLQRANQPDEAGFAFRIAGALGRPTKTGHWTESLSNLNDVLAEESGTRHKARQDYENLKLKYELQNASTKSGILKEQADMYTGLAKIRQPNQTRIPPQQWAIEVLTKADADPKSVTEAQITRANKILFEGKGSNSELGEAIRIKNDPNSSPEDKGIAIDIINKKTYIRPERAAKEAPEPVFDPQSAQVLAQRFGVPVNANPPFMGVDRKTSQQLLVSENKRAQKAIEATEEEANKAGEVETKMKRFLELNKKVNSGKLSGMLPSVSSEAQEMDKITAELAPMNRAPNSGSVSDFDAKQLLKATVSASNNYETNKNIVEAWKAYRRTITERSNFLSNYYAANKTLAGAPQQWQRYMNANPIFDPKKEGTFAPNKARKTYKDFFYPQTEEKAMGGRVGYAEGGDVELDDNVDGLTELVAKYDNYANGGAVRMQEGGVPPDSVIRLKPIQSSDAVNKSRAFFGQGMAMSAGDEAEALYRRYFGDDGRNKDYNQILNEVRADYRRWGEENPAEQIGYELAGGMAPTAAMMLTPGGQGAAVANTGRMAALTRTPMRRAIASGTAQGGISGFNAGEGGVQNRLGSAAMGATTGAIAAPVVGKTAELMGRGARGAVNLARQPFRAGDSYYENQAMNKVLEKMRQDGITPRQALGRVADERGLYPTPNRVGTRPDTRLMDTSQGLTDLAETVAQRPGSGRTNLVEAMKDRVRGTKGKVSSMVNEQLAGGKTYYKEMTDLTKDLRSSADGLYTAAYAHGDVSDPRIMKILQTPEFKRAYQEVLKTNEIKKANAIARGEDPSRFDLKQIYKVKEGQDMNAPVLDMELVSVPDVRTLDNIKQGLDTVIMAGRSSDDKLSRESANALKDLKNTFVDIIDQAVPSYKIARNKYKGDIEVIDALDVGRKEFPKMLPEQAADYVKSLSEAEKQALRIGYSQHFQTKIGEAKNSINAAEQIIGAQNEKARLRTLFDTDAEYKLFENALLAESRNFKNAGQVVANSATERRRMGRKEFESGNDAVSELLDATRGGVVSTVLSIARKAPSLFRNEKVAAKVSDILSTGSPDEINKILGELNKRASSYAREASINSKITNVGAKGAAKMSGESPLAADYERPEGELAPSGIAEESSGAALPMDLTFEPETPEPEIIEVPVDERAYGGHVRHFEGGGYAEVSAKDLADHAKMVEYQKARRKQADDYLKQVYDKRAKTPSRSPMGGVGGGSGIGHIIDPSAVKSLIPNFDQGGSVGSREADYVSTILDRMDVSAYADQMQQGKNKSKFMTGRMGYRQPIGDNAQISGGVSGRAVDWEGEDSRGNKYAGGKSGISGADIGYSDDKQSLMAKYAVPMGENSLAFQSAQYSRNLPQNRGRIGISHQRISPEGIRRDPRTELFYNKQFKNGGMVNVMRKMRG
jgi:hypothetical protein